MSKMWIKRCKKQLRSAVSQLTPNVIAGLRQALHGQERPDVIVGQIACHGADA